MVQQTNVVHAALLRDGDLGAVRAQLERFGDVAAVNAMADDDVEKVSATFYDVRAAAQAVEELSGFGCTFGPQVGNRRVEVSGPIPLKADDFSGVSNIFYQGEWNGHYVLEFFDVRDAQRFESQMAEQRAREEEESCVSSPPPGLEPAKVADKDSEVYAEADDMLPPGLEPPPGLDSLCGLADPGSLGVFGDITGLNGGLGMCSDLASAASTNEDDDEEGSPCHLGATYDVRITGLPNRLLTDVMLEAMLDQAGVGDGVVTFSFTHGSNTGETLVSFGDAFSASNMIEHVRGMRWGQGTKLTAHLVTPEPSAVPAAQEKNIKKLNFSEQNPRAPTCTTDLVEEVAGMAFSKDSPAYVRTGLNLSASAAAFVPFSVTVGSEMLYRRSLGQMAHRRAGSDASTGTGDSDAEAGKA